MSVMRSFVVPLLVIAAGCGTDSPVEVDSDRGTLSFSLAFPPANDVTQVEFRVVNLATSDEQSRRVPLSPVGLPPEIDVELAGHAFADWFVVLDPGDYAVTATPLDADGRPSRACASASGNATVVASETTELLLVSRCRGSSGGLDVTLVFDHVPFIEEVDFRPSKFTCAGDVISIAVTASDADGDPLTFAWSIVDTPDNADDTSYCLGYLGGLASFSALVPGRYEIVLTVSAAGDSATLRMPIYVHRCPIEACPGDLVRDALPEGATFAGACTCGFEPFDPATDWPSGRPQGPSTFDALGCLPPFQYDPVTGELIPRATNTPCPDNYCVQLADGTYQPTDEAGATQASCEAFETSFCVPDVGAGDIPVQDDGTRLGCDDAPALPGAQCRQIEICPDAGDVPANAAQTADPPQFPELPALEPPDTTVPPGVVTIADNLTRFVPPCFWDTLQDNARVFAAPVPAYGDNGLGRVDTDPTNFSGLPLGADCSRDIECRSNFCEFVDELDPQAVCQLREILGDTLRRDPEVNRSYWDPNPKGSDRWSVDLGGGLYAADAHVQGVFYPSVGWSLNAGGDFRMDVTAAGVDLDRLVFIDAAAHNSNCGWSYTYEVRLFDLLEDFDGFELGAGGLFVAANDLGQASGSNGAAAEQQCNDALAELRDQEEITNQRLWDALLATALWNNYGPSPAIPNQAALGQYRTDYEAAIGAYLADLADYTTLHETESAHAFGVDIADLDAGLPLWRPARIEHHIGPFVLGAETSIVGKVGVDVLLKSQTDFGAAPGEADAALGVEVTPHADVLGYMAVYGGVDIFIASVEVGLRGELQMAGVYLPLVLSGGLVRDELPIDQGSFGNCIDDATLATFVPGYAQFLTGGGSGLPCPSNPGTTGLPIYGNFATPMVPPSGAIYRAAYGYNVGVEGRILDGAIKAFVRAQLLFTRSTWTKTLVEWDGLHRTYLSIAGTDVFANSFDTEVGSITLPVVGTTVDLWPGPQRDMVYLPDLEGAAGAPGDLPQTDDLFDLLDTSLQQAPEVRWGRGEGLCGVFVP